MRPINRMFFNIPLLSFAKYNKVFQPEYIEPLTLWHIQPRSQVNVSCNWLVHQLTTENYSTVKMPVFDTGRDACRFLRALLIRALFLSHALVMIWTLSYYKQDPRYFYMTLSLILLVIETTVTLKVSPASVDWNDRHAEGESCISRS